MIVPQRYFFAEVLHTSTVAHPVIGFSQWSNPPTHKPTSEWVILKENTRQSVENRWKIRKNWLGDKNQNS